MIILSIRSDTLQQITYQFFSILDYTPLVKNLTDYTEEEYQSIRAEIFAIHMVNIIGLLLPIY